MGRIMCALVLATAVGGCAQLFGFDQTEPYERRLTLTQKFASATVDAVPIDLSTSAASFLVVDPAEPTGLAIVPARLEGLDTFFAELPADQASILYTTPFDAITRVWSFPARHQRGVLAVLGRANANPASITSQLDLLVTLDVAYAGEALWFYAIGPWAYRNFPELPALAATTWDPPAVPWDSATSLTSRPLARIRAVDSLWVLRYVGPVLGGVLPIPGFEQMDDLDAISPADPMVTVALDRTLDAQFGTMIASPRYAATTPTVAGLTMSWSINASPAAEIGSSQGPQLHRAALTELETGAVTAAYGNPFPWPETVTFTTRATRVFTPPPPLVPITLVAAMTSIQTPGPGLVFDLPQGLPLLVSLDGRALTADGMAVVLDRTRAVEASFVLDREAACDLYGLRLDELADDGGGVATRVVRVDMAGAEPRWIVPNELFAPGVRYTLRAFCDLGGTPGVADGDLVTRSWPAHTSHLDSAVFTVMP